jgi:transcriptional regulator NrdR family protein
MKCPKCNRKAKAYSSRFVEYTHSQRRVRTCECGFKFTTYERIEEGEQDRKSSKEKKKEFYRKVLKDLIDDLEGRTYLHDPRRDSTLWEEV